MTSGDRPCCACGELIPAEALFCGACGVKDPHREPAPPPGGALAPEAVDVTMTTVGLQQAQPYKGADAGPPKVTAGAVVRSPLAPQPSTPPTSTTVIAPAPVAEAPAVTRSSSTVPKATVLKTQQQVVSADARPAGPSGPPSARAALPPPAPARKRRDDATMVGKSSLPPRVNVPPKPARPKNTPSVRVKTRTASEPGAEATPQTAKPDASPTPDEAAARLQPLSKAGAKASASPARTPVVDEPASDVVTDETTADETTADKTTAETTAAETGTSNLDSPAAPTPPKKVQRERDSGSQSAQPRATVRTPAVSTPTATAPSPVLTAARVRGTELQTQPDLTGEISEARFFLDQGLEDDAKAVYQTLAARHPNHTEVHALGVDLGLVDSLSAEDEPGIIELDMDELDDVDDVDEAESDAGRRDAAARDEAAKKEQPSTTAVSAADDEDDEDDEDDDAFGAAIDAAIDAALDDALDLEGDQVPAGPDVPDGVAAVVGDPADAASNARTTDVAPQAVGVASADAPSPDAAKGALGAISSRGKARASDAAVKPRALMRGAPRGSTPLGPPSPPPGPRPPDRASRSPGDPVASSQLDDVSPDSPEPLVETASAEAGPPGAQWPAPDPGGTQIVRLPASVEPDPSGKPTLGRSEAQGDASENTVISAEPPAAAPFDPSRPYAADEPTTVAGSPEPFEDDRAGVTMVPEESALSIAEAPTLASIPDAELDVELEGEDDDELEGPTRPISKELPRITIVPGDASGPAQPRPFSGEAASPFTERGGRPLVTDRHEPVPGAPGSLPSAPSAPRPSLPPTVSTPTPPAGAAVAADPVRLVMLGPRGEAVAERTIAVGHALPLGRGSGDPWADDQHMDLQHARLVPGAGGVFVEDLGTTGVFCQVSERVAVRDQDQFKVGQSWIRYERARSDGAAAGWGQLVVHRHGGQPVQTISIGGAGLLLGREEGDLTFNGDTYVSSAHCRFLCEGEDVWIEDLGSSNGTYLRVRPGTPVAFGALLLVGHTQFKIRRG